MENVDSFTAIAWIAGSVLTFALALRLWLIGLASVYTAFFSYLCLTVVRDIVLWTTHMTRKHYADFYMISQAVMAILFALVIVEIYSLVLAKFPAIRTFSRWVSWGATGLCALLWGSLTYLDVTAKRTPTLFDVFLSVERGVYAALVMLILIVSLFLLWFPVKLPRNVIAHSLIFAGYFLSKATVLLFRTVLSQPHFKTLDAALLYLSCAVVLLWMAYLRPSGEHIAVVLGHQWNQADQNRLLGQLDAINTALARAGQQ